MHFLPLLLSTCIYASSIAAFPQTDSESAATAVDRDVVKLGKKFKHKEIAVIRGPNPIGWEEACQPANGVAVYLITGRQCASLLPAMVGFRASNPGRKPGDPVEDGDIECFPSDDTVIGHTYSALSRTIGQCWVQLEQARKFNVHIGFTPEQIYKTDETGELQQTILDKPFDVYLPMQQDQPRLSDKQKAQELLQSDPQDQPREVSREKYTGFRTRGYMRPPRDYKHRRVLRYSPQRTAKKIWQWQDEKEGRMSKAWERNSFRWPCTDEEILKKWCSLAMPNMNGLD